MTGSTATPHEHAHNPISALKGVFANRPSSRDRRNGDAPEDGSERLATGHRGLSSVLSLFPSMTLLSDKTASSPPIALYP